MKRMVSLFAMAALLGSPIAADAAEAIYGVWVREGHPEDKLEFYDCAGKLCAKGILPMLDGSPAPEVLRNAVKTGPNQWKGDLFNPEDGKTYTGKVTLDSPNQFTLTGCLVAFLCQSEAWTRVANPSPPAAAAPAHSPAAPAQTAAPAHSPAPAHGAAPSAVPAPAANPASKPAIAPKPAAKPAPKPAPAPEQ